ncbi:unnamed protein product, partial [Candidula unifasciata]
VTVPDFEVGYPKPKPPRDRKKDIYKPADYAHIDNRVRQQQASLNTSTYESLVNSLTAGCTTDLQKLRAIFVWLYLQNIHGSFYSRVTDPHTPKGYMKVIKTNHGSYASFFAQLCRAAAIPCNVIRGVGKGDKYVTGQQNCDNMESAWNAVYVAGEWRLIHPLWSFFQEKQTYENGLSPPAGTKRSSIEEFYWLTDPDAFICFCKSNNDEWQLLGLPWTEKKFLNNPHFTEEYFTCGLTLPNTYNALINCDTCNLLIAFEHEKYIDPTIDGRVEREYDNNDDRATSDMDMTNYVVTSSSSTKKTLVVRFPVRGWYYVDIFGGLDNAKPKLVSFRVHCQHRGKDPLPFPLNPPEGFGITQTADRYGVSDPEPDTGIILVRQGQQKRFVFTCMQKLDAKATLTHIKQNSDNLADCITTKTSDSQLDVLVNVPDESPLEFGLVIAVRKENERGDFTVVANYLLVDENWQKNVATVPPSKDEVKHQNKDDTIRRKLIAATNGDNIETLENAIGDFEHHGLDDEGDLTRAKNKLVHLHLDNLRRTTSERQLAELEKAIDSANASHVAPDLRDSDEMAEAEKTRQQLKRLKLYLHKVLALNKATIAEIHSYQRPRPLVHQVMKATFRILGEPNSRVQNWTRVQNSMRQLGHNSMLGRMGKCDVVHLKKTQVQDAEFYLSDTNIRSVRMVSAGAATFYVWSNNMISEYHGKNDEKSARNADNRNGDTKRYDFNSAYSPSPGPTPRDELKSR